MPTIDCNDTPVELLFSRLSLSWDSLFCAPEEVPQVYGEGPWTVTSWGSLFRELKVTAAKPQGNWKLSAEKKRHRWGQRERRKEALGVASIWELNHKKKRQVLESRFLATLSAGPKGSMDPGTGDLLKMKVVWGSSRAILSSLFPNIGKEPCSEAPGQCWWSSNFPRLRCCFFLF